MKNNRQFIAIAINIVVLVFIFFGLFYNDWGVYPDNIWSHSDVEVHVGLREVTATDGDETHHYNWEEWDSDFYTAGIVTFFILWMAAVCCIASIVVSIPIKLKKSYRRLGIRTNFISAGIILIGITLWIILTASERGDYKEFQFGWAFYGMIVSIILLIISAIMLMKFNPKGKDIFRNRETYLKNNSMKLHSKRFGIVYLSCFVIIALLMGIYSHNWAYQKNEIRTSSDGAISYGGDVNLGLKNIVYELGDPSYVPLSDPESYFSSPLYDYKYWSDLNNAGSTTALLLWIGIILMCVFIGIYLFSLTHDTLFEYSFELGFFSGIIIIIAPIIWYWLAPIKEDYWHLGWSFYLVLGAGIVQTAVTILYHFIFRNNMKDVDPIEVKPM